MNLSPAGDRGLTTESVNMAMNAAMRSAMTKESGGAKPNPKAKLGQGGRFAALEQELGSRRGKSKVSNPGALAAYIGRRKYGAKRFNKLAAAGK